jgi:hypothetical protein
VTTFAAPRGPNHKGRIMALGNGWVPAQAVYAWHTLSARVLDEVLGS